MCGVRCTPNLAAYCNNGLNLTSRGGGVIFKLLHKLIFKCLITYFSVLYHGERFQIKGTFSKVHRQQKLSLYFPLSFLAKLQVSCYGITCKLPTCFQLCSTYYLLQLTYRAQRLNSSASTAYYLLNPPPSVCVSSSQFCLCYSSELRCKGSAFICFLQAFPKINAYSLTFIVFIMLIQAIL